jgi:hypothetical protein
MFDDAPNPEDVNNAEGIDCLKVEFRPQTRAVEKETSLSLKAAAFKPATRGCVWAAIPLRRNPGGIRGTSIQAEAEQTSG